MDAAGEHEDEMGGRIPIAGEFRSESYAVTPMPGAHALTFTDCSSTTWTDASPQVEFGRQNGHYVVPNPLTDDIPKAERAALVKSDEYRLYNWVESLHKMYRSYKLGRQSGSLTDERVVLLIKHGFLFRKV